MEQPSITVETPRDSTILAYGTAPSISGRRFFLLGLGIFAVGLLGFFAWFGFSRPLPVGIRTLTVVIRPSIAQTHIPPQLREQLPLSWKKALRQPSSWPVLLGGGLGGNGWTWFAVVPRWHSADGLPTATRGLARVIYEEAPLPATTQVSYTEGLGAWLRDPRPQASGTIALETFSASSTSLSFRYLDRIFHTSLRFEHRPGAFSPRAADLSIDLSLLSGDAREEVFNELPIPRFVRLPTLQEAHLVFHEEGRPEEVELNHREDISTEAIKQVLAGFGVTTKRVIRLTDGTLATELTSGEGVMDKPVPLSGGGSLLIGKNTIRYGSSTEPLAHVSPACGNHPIAGRMSARALQKLMQGVGLTLDLSWIAGWQAGEDANGMLVICPE